MNDWESYKIKIIFPSSSENNRSELKDQNRENKEDQQ